MEIRQSDTPWGIIRLMKRRNLFIAAVAAASILLTGCSSDSADSPLAPAQNTQSVVIDVRTPAEYSAGHVEGALNIDVEDASFQSAISTLDPDVTYLVYCRSGRRSAVAKGVMEQIGLTVVDGGAFTAMQDLGWPTA
jgi:phage shock protein E